MTVELLLGGSAFRQIKGVRGGEKPVLVPVCYQMPSAQNNF